MKIVEFEKGNEKIGIFDLTYRVYGDNNKIYVTRFIEKVYGYYIIDGKNELPKTKYLDINRTVINDPRKLPGFTNKDEIFLGDGGVVENIELVCDLMDKGAVIDLKELSLIAKAVNKEGCQLMYRGSSPVVLNDDYIICENIYNLYELKTVMENEFGINVKKQHLDDYRIFAEIDVISNDENDPIVEIKSNNSIRDYFRIRDYILVNDITNKMEICGELLRHIKNYIGLYDNTIPEPVVYLRAGKSIKNSPDWTTIIDTVNNFQGAIKGYK